MQVEASAQPPPLQVQAAPQAALQAVLQPLLTLLP